MCRLVRDVNFDVAAGLRWECLMWCLLGDVNVLVAFGSRCGGRLGDRLRVEGVDVSALKGSTVLD
jgi:hypothetical protein